MFSIFSIFSFSIFDILYFFWGFLCFQGIAEIDQKHKMG